MKAFPKVHDNSLCTQAMIPKDLTESNLMAENPQL